MPIIYFYLQVEYICINRSIVQRNVRICGLFSVNLAFFIVGDYNICNNFNTNGLYEFNEKDVNILFIIISMVILH